MNTLYKHTAIFLLLINLSLPVAAQVPFGRFLIYDNIGLYKAGYAIRKDNSFRYDSVVIFAGKYLKGIREHRWGIVDSANKVILPFQYQQIEQLNSLRYVAVKKNNKYQIFDFIDSIYTQQYDYALVLYGDLLSVKRNGKFGIVDIKDNVIVPFAYDYIMYHAFNPNVVLTKSEKKYSVFNLRLKKTMQCNYDSISGYNIGKTKLMAAYLNGKCGLIDEDCNIKLPLIYKALYVYGEKYIEALDQNNQVQIVDFNNRVLKKEELPDEYQYLLNRNKPGG